MPTTTIAIMSIIARIIFYHFPVFLFTQSIYVRSFGNENTASLALASPSRPATRYPTIKQTA